MTLAGVAIVAFFAMIVLPRAAIPMADGDAWWHIHAGEQILATSRIPDTNTWTIAGEGFRWISQDWLSNVLMAALFNAGDWGVAWLSLAFAGIVVGAFALLWSVIGRRASVSWLAKFGFLTIGLVVAGPIIGIRVQTVDLVMTAFTVAVLWSHLGDPRPWWPFALVPIALLWVNLHAGWVMLFLLGGAVLVGELFDRWSNRSLAQPPLSGAALGWLLAGLVLSAGVLVVNPNGLGIYAYPFETASIGAHRDFLVEWSPPNPTSFEGQVAIGFLVLVVVPTVVLSWRRMRTSDLLWLAGLSILTLGAVRFAIFLGPVGAAIAAIHLAPRIGAVNGLTAIKAVVDRWQRPPRTAATRRANVALLATMLAIGGVLAIARSAPATQAPSIAAAVPMAAAGWLEVHAADARIFNTYSWGGYLARRLPEAKIYIDGRSDIYGDEPIQRYAATLNVSTDPSALLDEARINAVLVKPEAPINGWLESATGWRRVYTDNQSVIWMREDG